MPSNIGRLNVKTMELEILTPVDPAAGEIETSCTAVGEVLEVVSQAESVIAPNAATKM